MTDLDAVIDAVGTRRTGQARRLTWIGESIVDLDDPNAAEVLADVLYASAYISGAPTPLKPAEDRGVDPGWASIQVDRRMAATWGGWTITGRDTLQAPEMPTIRLEPQGSRTLGATVAIPIPAVSTNLIPGWCFVHHGDVRLGAGTVRLYANTRPEAAQALVTELTTVLLDAGLPHVSAKFLVGREHADRADSTVVYLPTVPAPRLLERLVAVFTPAIANEATPLFTRRLLPGIALAGSPKDGTSFGQLRCKQVSSALVAHIRAGRRDTLVVPFDPARPWNEPANGRLDDVAAPLRPSKPSAAAADPETALHELADELARSAITVDGRATWLVRDQRSGRLVSAGAAIYDGAAGPLAVLAQARRLSDNNRHLVLLRAAARAMLDRQHEIPLDGFHSGQAGTAAALAEAADLAQDDQLTQLALKSLAQARQPRPSTREWDLLAGTAGTILGVSAAAGLLGVDVSEDVQHWAECLLARGENDARTGGIRWRSRIGRCRPTLAGLAHGGSGAALALAVASTPEHEFAEVVARSANFEDIRRSSADGWTDHRNPTAKRVAVAWCHGAGGIGLASAALDLHWPGAFKARTQLAAERLAASMFGPTHDRGLCHGRSGRALALAVVADHLGDNALSARACSDLVAMGKAPEGVDLGMMNGETGVAIARLAGAGLARPPIAFLVDLRLLHYDVTRDDGG